MPHEESKKYVEQATLMHHVGSINYFHNTHMHTPPFQFLFEPYIYTYNSALESSIYRVAPPDSIASISFNESVGRPKKAIPCRVVKCTPLPSLTGALA